MGEATRIQQFCRDFPRGPPFALGVGMNFVRVSLVVLSIVGLAGCSCGVGAVPSSSGDTAKVSQDGTVVFNAIPVGQTESFSIPIKESADTDETIVTASTNGAFTVLSSLPIYVPRGTAASIEVSFAPSVAGNASADLVLGTEKMGNSHVALTGTGLAR